MGAGVVLLLVLLGAQLLFPGCGADAPPRSSRYEARATSERTGEIGTKAAAPVAAIRTIAGVATFIVEGLVDW